MIATDFGVPALSTRVKVYVEVTDINDNYPVFREKTNQTYVISYQTEMGSSITVVSATDADSSDLNKLIYSIQQPGMIIYNENK